MTDTSMNSQYNDAVAPPREAVALQQSEAVAPQQVEASASRMDVLDMVDDGPMQQFILKTMAKIAIAPKLSLEERRLLASRTHEEFVKSEKKRFGFVARPRPVFDENGNHVPQPSQLDVCHKIGGLPIAPTSERPTEKAQTDTLEHISTPVEDRADVGSLFLSDEDILVASGILASGRRRSVIESTPSIHRFSTVVDIDDLYADDPSDTFLGDVSGLKYDERDYEYQGPVEYLLAVGAVKRMFFINFFVIIGQMIYVFFPAILRFLGSLRPSSVIRGHAAARRLGYVHTLKVAASVTVFISTMMFVMTTYYTILSICMAILIDFLNDQHVMLPGLSHGAQMWVSYVRACVVWRYHKYILRRWERRLPDEYVPIAVYGRGVLCLFRMSTLDHNEIIFINGSMSEAYLMPRRPWCKHFTGREDIQYIDQVELKYLLFWDKHIQVRHLNYKDWKRWNVFGCKPLDSPAIMDIPSSAAYQGPVAATDFSDFINSVNSIPGYGGPTVAVITDVVALVTLVLETRSKAVLVTQALALCTRYPQLGDIIISEIKQSIDKIQGTSDTVFDQAFAPVYQGSFTSGFRDTELGNEFFNFITLFTSSGVAATIGLIDLDVIKSLQRAATHAAAFESLEKVLVRFARFLASLISTLKKCWDAKSIAPLYAVVSMSPTRYVKLASELMHNVHIRDSSNHEAYLRAVDILDKDLRNGQISENIRLNMMEELYTLGNSFDSLSRNDYDAFIYQTVQNTRASLRKEIDSLTARNELSRFKVEPYSIGLAGPAGVGKSLLVRSMQRITASYLGVSDSAGIGFQWKVGQKYADGLTSAKRVYVFDDTDQKTGAPAYGDQTPYVDYILVRNSKPTMANMAEAQDKGKYAYNALMTMWVSNKMPTWKDVKIHVSDPHAFARRFNDMWWCELREGLTPADAEAGRVDDSSWVFTEYKWNPAARQESDNLFVKSGRIITSRKQLLQETNAQFKYKMAREKVKMVALNAVDLPPCSVCGLSMSDHVDSPCEMETSIVAADVNKKPPHLRPPGSNHLDGVAYARDEPGPVFMHYPPSEHMAALAVYQGPEPAPEAGVGDSPIFMMQGNRCREAKAAINEAINDIKNFDPGALTYDEMMHGFGCAIAGLYGLHFIAMLSGFCFVTLMVEIFMIVVGVSFVNLDEDGKIKVALLFFPKTAILWMIGRGIMKFEMPTMERMSMSIKNEAVMDKLKIALPILIALSLLLVMWSNRSKPSYQSVVTEGEDIVRINPKKDQWELMANTPRNVSTNEARTFNKVGFKRRVESCVGFITYKSKKFPMLYINSKTWITNAHHFVDGAPPRFSETAADMVLEEQLSFTFEIGSYRSNLSVPSASCFVQVPGKDVMLVRLDDVPSPGAGLRSMLPADMDVSSEYSGGLLFDLTDRSKPVWSDVSGNVSYAKSRSSDRLMLSYWTEGGNRYGMCGSPVCAPTTSGGWLFLGIHTAGMVGTSLAEPITRSMMETYGARLYPSSGVRKEEDIMSYQSGLLREPGNFGPGSDIEVVPTYARTHVNSAVRMGAKVLAVGTIKGFHARKFKSDVKDTPFKNDVALFSLSNGVSPMFVNPKVLITRKSENEIITSPFTQVLTRRVNRRGDPYALRWAVEDYLSPILAMLRETKPYVKYTYAEAFSGMGDLAPTNLQTSTGPPYNSRKCNYMRRAGPSDWEVEPNLAADMKILEDVLKSGCIPSVVINDCVKAEPISVKKAEECRQRILEVGPVVHSTKLKSLMGFIAGVIKQSKGLFEMSIGANVYGLDAERLYERLCNGPCFDGDIVMQDGRASTQVMDHICEMLIRMCEAAGMPDDDLEELRLLLLSFGDRLVCILGDLVIVNGGNPSGWYGTALVASMITTLLLRTSFYLAHVDEFGTEPTMTYRSCVSTEVQGDDNVNSVRDNLVRRWFSGDVVAEKAGEYGHEYTSADKAGEVIGWKDVSEVSYLKRSFKEINGCVVMPLELKSIAKQLMFYREPEGGSVEAQLAVNITNASRELSLHGKETYDSWMPLLKKCGDDSGASRSRFFRIASWEETFNGVITGTLDALEADFIPTAEDFVYQGDMAPATNLTVAPSATTEVVIVPAPPSAVVSAPQLSQGASAQHRAVKIRSQSLSTANTSGSVLCSIDVVANMLANTQLIDIFDRYWSFQYESVTLRIQHNSSGSMYGRYIVSLVPEAKLYGTTPLKEVGLYNATHASRHYIFNPANNEDVEFTLPWMGFYDSSSSKGGSDQYHTWRLSIICLCPLTDAVNSTGAAVSTLSVIANFNDVKFGMPVYQGPKKTTIRPSTILGAAAAVAGVVAAVSPALPAVLPVALGLAAAGKALSEAGHTRHLAPAVAHRMMPTAVTGLGPVDGVDEGMVNDWIQAAQITTNPVHSGGGTSVDEMTFSSLAVRQHIVAVPGMSPSNATGYVLACVPVTPYVSWSTSGAYCYHPLAHATLFAAYWRATLKYDVTFSCNALQSGSIFAFWQPSFSTVGSTVSTDFVSGASGCIIEIDPVKRYRIGVPWASPFPMARVKGGTSAASKAAEDCNGYLIFVVMNPLAAPYSASIQMVVEMSVSDDFVIGGARIYNDPYDVASATVEDNLKVQGTLTQSGEEIEECWAVSGGPIPELDGVVISSAVTSVKAFCQRYCHFTPQSGTYTGTFNATATPASSVYWSLVSFPFYPCPPCVGAANTCFRPQPVLMTRSAGATTFSNSTSTGFSMIGWLSPMYMGSRGGMSHKIIVPSPANIKCIKVFDYVGVKRTDADVKIGGFVVPAPRNLHGVSFYPTTTSGVQSFDVVTPYNSNRRFYPNCQTDASSSFDARWLMLMVNSNGDFDLQMLSAAAADFSFVGFRFSPMIETSSV